MIRWIAIVFVVFTATVPKVRGNTIDPFHTFRGLWVTRWDYRNGNASTVQTIVDNAASLGITDLVFQVRGRSDAYYDSNFEPRAEALGGTWDPLQVAIDAAHNKGIKLHAWINTMPLWLGTTAPNPARLPQHTFYNTDPSFRIYDAGGNPQPLNSSYVIANPILPEWQSHVNDVVGDIAANYNVDGIHLDYVRWLGSTSYSDLPHDDYSHQLFQQATGRDASNPSNAEAYREYIRERITDLVRDLGSTIDSVDPAVDLSAAVWRDPDVGHDQVLQDYRVWLEDNLVDILIPMIYLSPSNNYLFEPNLTNVLSIATDARVAPGIGVYLHDNNNGGPEFTVQQLETLYNHGTNGVTLFAYSSFFSSGQLGIDRQIAVKDFLDSTIPRLLGDMDLDDDIDFDDIDDFVLGLNSSSGYEAIYGIHPKEHGDMDADGDIDFDDIDGFVQILVTGVNGLTSNAVPEPPAAVLLASGLIVVAAGRYRRRGPHRDGRPATG